MSDSERTIRCLPLNSLIPSPLNVRKTPAEGAAFEQLKASIAAHGLLENLLVQPAQGNGERDDCHEVVAGARRLAALRVLAEDGAIPPDHPVPCHVVANGDNAVELSLVENTVRAAMHPADQVEAFAEIAREGGTVAEIAARFGVSERTVEQRLRLGNAAPELLDAYRAGEMGLQALQAFCATADTKLQLAVWDELKAQHSRPGLWQIRRLLTEGRIPATAAIARFIGADAYEAAGGALTRDLFAEEDDRGIWFDDPALLRKLTLERLEAAAEELRTKWSWAEARVEVEWSDTARFAQIRPKPGEPTEAETEETERLNARCEELRDLADEDWTDETASEFERIEARLKAIKHTVSGRAVFRRKDLQIAGAIVTVGDDGNMRVIQGLVRPEDLPSDTGPANDSPADGGPADGESASANGAGGGAHDPSGFDGHIRPPAISRPDPVPDPAAEARKRVGIGIGLGDDLRAIRTSLIKAHLAEDFEAAFDLCVFQMARALFQTGYRPHALDIKFSETADRPPMRRDDENFSEASQGERMLRINRASLPLDWLQIEDDGDAFRMLRDLPADRKQALFAACVARTVQGQLAFEPSARPELEATAARLDLDFPSQYRPDADIFWKRLTKAKLLEVAAKVLGPDWASARAKSKKAVLVSSMARAFGADEEQALHISPLARAAALKWTPPGFEPFDAGEPVPETEADDTAETSGQPDAGATPDKRGDNGDGSSAAPANGEDAGQAPDRAAANGEDADAPEVPATEVPEFLRFPS